MSHLIQDKSKLRINRQLPDDELAPAAQVTSIVTRDVASMLPATKDTPKNKSDEMEKGFVSEENVYDTRPGDTRVAGLDGSNTDDVSANDPQNEGLAIENASQDTKLVDAVLVDREAEELEIRKTLQSEHEKMVPLAEAVMEKPWYRRNWFIAEVVLVLVAIGVTVGAVVGTRDDAEDVSTSAPTATPVPAVMTSLLQLDSKPEETGWILVCDGNTIVDVPPGSYAILTGARPHFRMEYLAASFEDDECELTIVDTGNFGDDIGSQVNRIFGGLVNPTETKVTVHCCSSGHPTGGSC